MDSCGHIILWDSLFLLVFQREGGKAKSYDYLFTFLCDIAAPPFCFGPFCMGAISPFLKLYFFSQMYKRTDYKLLGMAK